LKESTIFGHLAVLVGMGELDAQDYVEGESQTFWRVRSGERD